MEKKYFPIKTKTTCQLKWAWSTLYLNTGVTRSCHRTGESVLSPENFFNFHNTPLKIDDRTQMLAGQWPKESCSYCKNIEEAGGTSDRIRSLAIPGHSPNELDTNPTATSVDPTLIEVYFNNTCNLGCLYCTDTLSSSIAAENKKFGNFEKYGVSIKSNDQHFKELVPYFWQWFETGFQKIRRLHVLGGEPFYQREFDHLLQMIEKYPNPDCELNVVTNLMIPTERLANYIEKFKSAILNKHIKRVDITCSIDCWGAEQEYVRHGLKLETWLQNFEFLLSFKWLTLNINQTIMPLTIKTMPDLLSRLADWKKQHPVGHFFSGIFPAPDYLKLEVLGGEIFADDIHKIINMMPTETEQEQEAQNYMTGILLPILKYQPDPVQIKNMIIFLDEKDRRRSTNWRQVFPWLAEFEHHVV
jgi:pyruvate-formate lyase-activating enzyme